MEHREHEKRKMVGSSSSNTENGIEPEFMKKPGHKKRDYNRLKPSMLHKLDAGLHAEGRSLFECRRVGITELAIARHDQRHASLVGPGKLRSRFLG